MTCPNQTNYDGTNTMEPRQNAISQWITGERGISEQWNAQIPRVLMEYNLDDVTDVTVRIATPSGYGQQIWELCFCQDTWKMTDAGFEAAYHYRRPLQPPNGTTTSIRWSHTQT
jgi:hypothetical protein